MNNVGDMVCNSFSRPGVIYEKGKLEPCLVCDWSSFMKNNKITKLQICKTCENLCKDKLFIEEISKQECLNSIVFNRLVLLEFCSLRNLFGVKKWKSVTFLRCTFSSFSYSELMRFMQEDHFVEQFELIFPVFVFHNLDSEKHREVLHSMTSNLLNVNYRLLNIKLGPVVDRTNLNEIISSTENRNRNLLKFIKNVCLTFILIRKFRHSVLDIFDINLIKHLAKKIFDLQINDKTYLKNLSKQLVKSDISI